jgi:hypothetical protein
MGRIKNLMEEQRDSIWSGAEKYVCLNCVNDYALKKFIETNAVCCVCDYCKRQNTQPFASKISSFLEEILDGIKYEWLDPNDILPYESKEGGWIGEVYDTYDIQDYIEDVTGIENETLLEDIIDSLSQNQWCKGYEMSQSEALESSWNSFNELVKYKYRYTFFAIPEENYYDELIEGGRSISPKYIFEEIADIINSHDNLIKVFPKKSLFYRCRIFESLEHANLATVFELATPPPNILTSGRMNPHGIPLFYGAEDPDTAICETITCTKKQSFVVVGTFESLVPLRILNLCEIPDFPSLFDTTKRHLREPLVFLQNFQREISKPINQCHAIEYLPTQVMMEYFKHLFKDKSGNMLNGIIYRSPKRANKFCYALFVNNENCISCEDNQNNRSMLRLEIINIIQL